MEETPLGGRLSDYRDLLGWSQTALADQLGVAQAFVSQVERGDKPFPETLASDLAGRGEVPFSFFLVPTRSVAPVTFRKKASASVRDEKRIVAEFREAARLFEAVSREAGYHEARLPAPGDFEGDAVLLAEEVRRRGGIDPDEPVRNVTRLMERLGVGVVSTLEPGHAAEGEHVSISRPADANGRPLVAMIASCSGDRQRLSLAHELAHLIFDQKLTHGIRSTRSPEERRAFDFASALLVPDRIIRHAVSESVTLQGYLPLKARYGISVAALIQRAKRMGVISEDRARSLHIQRSSQGWTKHEPVTVVAEKTRLWQQSYRRVFPDMPNHDVAGQIGQCYKLLDDWFEDVPEVAADKVVSLASWRQRKVGAQVPRAASPSV
ncbi:MAG: XRE family transcriptional regulator [Propionibacteriaceae bacterium]|nr:XRE family transcriptional regulator [Propionibacteriaceae bacterium]